MTLPHDGPSRDACIAILPILQHGAREAGDDNAIRFWAGVVLYITGCMGGDVGFHNAALLLAHAARHANDAGELVETFRDDGDDEDNGERVH